MEPSTPRRYVLDRLAEGIAARTQPGSLLRVAIDGPDGAGKTTFARDLDDLLSPRLRHGAEVRRFSAEEVMAPVQVRRSAEAADPVWTYENAYNLPHIRQIAEGTPDAEPNGCVMLVDGLTLLRPELADLWDVTIYLSVPEDVALERMLARDALVFDDDEEERAEVARRYREAWIPAMRIYVDCVDPVSKADVLVDMHDPDKPVVVRWGGF